MSKHLSLGVMTVCPKANGPLKALAGAPVSKHVGGSCRVRALFLPERYILYMLYILNSMNATSTCFLVSGLTIDGAFACCLGGRRAGGGVLGQEKRGRIPVCSAVIALPY